MKCAMLIHKTRGIYMGLSRDQRHTWSMLDPSKNMAMSMGSDFRAVVEVLALLIKLYDDQALDYRILITDPDCEFEGAPYLSPQGLQKLGLSRFTNDIEPTDWLGMQVVKRGEVPVDLAKETKGHA